MVKHACTNQGAGHTGGIFKIPFVLTLAKGLGAAPTGSGPGNEVAAHSWVNRVQRARARQRDGRAKQIWLEQDQRNSRTLPNPAHSVQRARMGTRVVISVPKLGSAPLGCGIFLGTWVRLGIGT